MSLRVYGNPPMGRGAEDQLAWIEGYWRSLLVDGRLPSRRQIDAIEIGVLLPHMVLLDVLREPLDFRYRLVGGHIEDNVGRTLKGELISAVKQHDPSRTRLFETFAACVEKRAPVRLDAEFQNLQNRTRKLNVVALPLADDGVNVDTILAPGWFLQSPNPYL